MKISQILELIEKHDNTLEVFNLNDKKDGEYFLASIKNRISNGLYFLTKEFLFELEKEKIKEGFNEDSEITTIKTMLVAKVKWIIDEMLFKCLDIVSN